MSAKMQLAKFLKKGYKICLSADAYILHIKQPAAQATLQRQELKHI